ncbi:MAG: DNA topoisomerase III, partial [Oscillospiraceae bacterium]|nr:DNA topoisomerase III [Oscillospiraceae bacterium]
MNIVIAEKPAIARTLSTVLGASEKKNGYLEGNGWIVSWCLGHLADFIDAEGYDPKYAKWRREDLPILPEEWKYVILKDRSAQFAVLRKLLLRDDVDEAVNACDCAWEGERIFRTAYHLADCRKPVRRLWISSMEEDAIREGFQNLKPGADYDSLYEAALCRAKADWLVGINATRLFSVLYGRTLNIGRVASPTLALVVQREAEIANFQPIPFYHVKLSCGGLVLVGEKIDAKEDAASIAAACRGGEAVIRSIERTERAEKPPALFDLTALQREANRLLGYTAQQTLDYAQALYEKKLCTYPRTDSRFLTDDMESAVSGLATAASMLCEVKKPDEIRSKQVCDSRKVSDHHAIVPTR